MQYNAKTRARPKPYQKEGVLDLEDFLEIGGGALLADDMGLGKTLQALWLMRRQAVGDMFPALVVCPASVKYTWEHEAMVHTNLRAQVLEGRTPPAGHLGSVPKLLIINPDILKDWLPWLSKVGLQTLVLDESQYFTNIRTKRTKAAIALARQVPYKVAMSGTPLTNRPSELWPTLHMLRPDLFPSFFSYAQTYCKPKRAPWGWEYKGAENIPQLHALLKRSLMVRRLKSEVEDQLGGLGGKVRSVLPMELSSRAEYNKAAGDTLAWVRENYGASRAKAAGKAMAVTRIGYLLRLVAKLKAKSVVQWANQWLEEYPEEKLVLFGIHKPMLRYLCKHVRAKHVLVDGSVTGRKRKAAVDQFVLDKPTRLFVGNMRAAGTGVDGLQRVCNTLAFAETWWRPGDHTQAEDRIYRMGQERAAWVNYLVAPDTIEADLCQLIQTKQEIIHGTLDGKVVDSLDIFDQLLETLTKTQK